MANCFEIFDDKDTELALKKDALKESSNYGGLNAVYIARAEQSIAKLRDTEAQILEEAKAVYLSQQPKARIEDVNKQSNDYPTSENYVKNQENLGGDGGRGRKENGIEGTGTTLDSTGIPDQEFGASNPRPNSRRGSAVRTGSEAVDTTDTGDRAGNGLPATERMAGQQADVGTQRPIRGGTGRHGHLPGHAEPTNYDLRDKPNIALTPAKRRDINNLAEQILKKPVEDITEADKDILRQHTGNGGLDVKASQDKGASIFNQHYTDYTTTREIYAALDAAGIKVGKALEPSVGSGNFIGMYPDAEWTAVDIDQTNTEIVKRLYPKAKVFNESYETFPGKNFDTIISNVPFASFSSLAREHAGTIKPAFKAIHNFFFAQSVDKLKTGGIMAFMTSTGTMDGTGEAQLLRNTLIKQMDVIGAFRLPMGTQKANASTEVMIDVIFLQKRPEGVDSKQPEKNQAFAAVTSKDGYPINQYFVDYPDSVLGDLSIGKNKTSMGKVGWIVTGEADYGKMKLEPQDYTSNQKAEQSEFADPAEAEQYALKHGFVFEKNVKEPFYSDGIIYDKLVTYTDQEGQGAFGRKATGKNADKLAALAAIHDKPTAEAVQQYEEKFGQNPHKDKLLLVWAKSVHAERQLKEYLALFDKDYNLSGIFKEQVRFQGSGKIEIDENSPLLDRAESLEDQDGLLPLENSLLSADEIQDLLDSGDYAKAGNSQLQNARLYYAGNIYQKLDQAAKIRPAAQRDKQIAKLQSIKPPLIPIKAISITGRENWLPPSAIASIGKKEGRDGTVIIGENAIDDRQLLYLFTNFVNHLPLIKVGKDETAEEFAARLKEAQNLLNNEAIPLIKQKLIDDGLADEVVDAYNRAKNFFAAPVFDGRSLKNLPKTFRGKLFNLMKHQLQGAERAIYNKKGVLAFAPGLGKTPTAIVVADQLLQKGVMKKPLFIVPANTIPQWEKTTRDLYPNANVFEFPKYATGINKGKPKDWPALTAEDKEKMIFDLTNNRYDYTFISTNLAQKFTIPRKVLGDFTEDLVESISSMEKDDEELTKSQIKAKEQRLAKIRMLKASMMKTFGDDIGFDMGKLGFDAVFADEVQYYKNIGMQSEDAKGGLGANVAITATYPVDKDGNQDKTLDPVTVTLGSARSYDFRFKTRYIAEKNNGNNVFLLTGTPTPNKPLELMTLLHHLDTHILDEYGITNVGDFVGEFLDVNQVEEMGVDGTNKMRPQLTGIKNIDALKKIISRYVDYVPPEAAADLVRPKEINIQHTILRNETAEAIFADIQARLLRAIEDGKAKLRGERIQDAETVIQMYTAGRDASVDVRLYTPTSRSTIVPPGTLIEEETRADYSKIAKTVQLVTEQVKADPDATQLIFIDRLKYPGGKGSTHEDIRAKVMKATGLSGKQVVFINGGAFSNPDTGNVSNSAPKPEMLQRIMDYYNEGKIKVLVGNTSKLGVGVDLQVNTTDIYQLDIPYRPDEIEQRTNRGVRQGNRYPEVRVHTFNQPGTFDAMSYRIIAGKQGFNDVFWKDQSSDTADVRGEEAPNAYDAAIELEQDPLKRRKLEVERDLSQAATKSNVIEKAISNLAKRIKSATKNLDDYTEANRGIDTRPTPKYEDQDAKQRAKSIADFKTRMAEQKAKNTKRIDELKRDLTQLEADKQTRVAELDAHKANIAAMRDKYVVNGVVVVNDLKYSIASTPGFYSQLKRSIANLPPKLDNTNGKNVKLWLQSNADKLQIKKDELNFSGILDWLDLQDKTKVSKADILGYLDQGGVQVEETELGDVDEAEIEAFMSDEIGEGYTREEAIAYLRHDQENASLTKYANYRTPGGEDGSYRELLLTLPSDPINGSKWRLMRKDGSVASTHDSKSEALDTMQFLTSQGLNITLKELPNQQLPKYKSSHWDQPNVLAHIRYDERTDAEGNNVLFIQEIQSDWGQEGKRKGFKSTDKLTDEETELHDLNKKSWAGGLSSEQEKRLSELKDAGVGKTLSAKLIGLEPAPFVTDTKAWVALAIKRMMLHAAQNGFDRIAFATGEQSADLYDLRKQVTNVRYDYKNGSYDITAQTLEGNANKLGTFAEDKLADAVGKDLAEKIIESRESGKSYDVFAGNDLKVGGEGMKAFYDKIVPQVANDILKKVGGGKVEGINFTPSTMPKADDFDNAGSYHMAVLAYKKGKAEGDRVQPGFTLTPAMRQKLLAEGLPLFSQEKPASGSSIAVVKGYLTTRQQKLMAEGKLKVIQSHSRNRAQGFYDKGVITLVADNLGSKDQVQQVLGHESWHFARDNDANVQTRLKVIDAQFQAAIERVKNGKGTAAEREAWRRVTQANTEKDLQVEEFQSYLLEAYAEKPQSLSEAVQKAVRDLVALIRATLFRYGFNLNSFSVADLAAIARGSLGTTTNLTGISSKLVDADPLFSQSAMKSNAWIVTGFEDFEPDSDGSGQDAPPPTRPESTLTRNGAGAGENKITQSSESSNGTKYSIGDPLTEAKRKAGFGKKKNLPETIKAIVNQGFKTNAEAMKERWEEVKPLLEQGIFDRFLGIKRAEQEILGDVAHSQSGYIGARLSTGSSSTMAAVLQFGAPELREGIIQKKEGSKGLSEILQPVKHDLENFAAWMVGRRANRLMGEGKENNFTAAEIQALLDLEKPEYQEAAKGIADMNKAILDLAEASGLVDKEARAVFEHSDYIPFYRLMEDKASGGPRKKGGLSHQTSGIKLLKGGDNPLSDPLGNMMQNWAHLIDASMKNNALNKTLTNLDGSRFVEHVPRVEFTSALIPKDQIKKLLRESGLPKELVDAMPASVTEGIAKMWAVRAPTDPDTVRVMRGGKTEYFKINDAMLLTSLAAVNQTELGGIFKPMRYFKRLLTGAVTADPTFMARNFIRDSFHSWTIAEEKGFKLGVDSIHGAVKSFKEEGGFIDMMFAGASFQGGYGNYNNPDNARSAMDAILRKKGIGDIKGFQDSIIDTPRKYWEMYRSIGDAIENASREATLEVSKRAGNEKAQYLFEAKDLMDFSMQGSFAIVRALSDMLPFFNARLVGLYRLAKAGKTKEAQRLIMMKAASMTMLTLALLAINGDDDRYEELEDWDKDQYWHFFFGDSHFRIPKPFELGLLFGTIPERSARALLGKDTLKEYAARMGAGAGDTLAFNPVPQLFKPFLELYANKDMFTGRPIEGMADEGKLPSARYNEHTSEAMRALSAALPEGLGASPKRLEHLMHGYLGSMGMYVLGATDLMVRHASGMPELPETRVDKYPVLKAFYQQTPALNTKYGTQFYDMLNEVNQINKTINAYKKEGAEDKAKALTEQYADKLKFKKELTKTGKTVSELRKQIDVIYRSNKSPEEKRQLIDETMLKSNAVVRKAVQRSHEAFM